MLARTSIKAVISTKEKTIVITMDPKKRFVDKVIFLLCALIGINEKILCPKITNMCAMTDNPINGVIGMVYVTFISTLSGLNQIRFLRLRIISLANCSRYI